MLIGWSIQYNKAVYKDLIIFQISNNQFILLGDRIDYIAVEIYCCTETAQVMNANDVWETPYTALETICRKLQIKMVLQLGLLVDVQYQMVHCVMDLVVLETECHFT